MRTKTIILLAFACSSLAVKAEDQDGSLAELTTTIRSAEEPVQWAPHSVTVIKKSELETNYRRDLEDLESRVPGLLVDKMNTTPRGAAIAIRGLGSSNAAKSFDPSVALSVDGVYVGTHTGRMRVLFDFEQIEVARGPQGTLDGNPNLSGSINMTRTKPTGEFDVDTRLSVGIDDRRELDAVVNFPIIDGLSGKIAAFRRDQGGDYMKNVLSDRDENTEDYTLLTTTIAWEYDDLFSLSYTYDREDSDETVPALLNISAPTDLLCSTTATLPFPNCRRGVGNPELDSRNTTAQNFSNDGEMIADHHTLRVDFEVAGHKVTSITGHRSTEEIGSMDLDASNADFYHVNRYQDYEQLSQEFRVSGEYSEALTYQFGAYFLNTDYEILQHEHHILKQLGDAGLTEGHAAGEIQELNSEQDSNLRSIFASANYVINDQWIADIAARWTEVERDFNHSPSRIRLGNTVAPVRTLLVGEETTKQLLWSGGLSYKVDEEAMIYLRYSEGFLPGGFDENAMSAEAGNSYGAETTRGFEIGLKSDWWDDRLRANIAYFTTELDNKVERYDARVATDRIESILDNIADVEVSGWELEFESIPVDNLHLRATFTIMDSNYDSFSFPDLANPGAFTSDSGLTPTYAPSENLFVSAAYSIPFGPGVVHTYAGYRLLGDYQTFPLLPEAEVKNWTAWDLSVSYAWKDWEFRLFSNNVKNKSYIQNIRQVSQTDVLPVISTGSTVPVLNTYTEYNYPRYTGLEIIYRPNF